MIGLWDCQIDSAEPLSRLKALRSMKLVCVHKSIDNINEEQKSNNLDRNNSPHKCD